MNSPDDLDDLITTIGTQGIDILEGGPKIGGPERDDGFEPEEGEDVELDLTPGTLEKTNAVSYTHLDVYKRQFRYR